jgi:putative FmdB family regulatory protein
MPLYEYNCNDCGEKFELIVRFSEADKLPTCPKCESSDTHKKLSQVSSFGSAISTSPLPSGGSYGSRGGFS